MFITKVCPWVWTAIAKDWSLILSFVSAPHTAWWKCCVLPLTTAGGSMWWLPRQSSGSFVPGEGWRGNWCQPPHGMCCAPLPYMYVWPLTRYIICRVYRGHINIMQSGDVEDHGRYMFTYSVTVHMMCSCGRTPRAHKQRDFVFPIPCSWIFPSLGLCTLDVHVHTMYMYVHVHVQVHALAWHVNVLTCCVHIALHACI